MRAQIAALALTLLALPAAGQALRPAPSSGRDVPPPGYSAFTAAPVPSILPREISLADRAGSPDEGGPVNAEPFSGVPFNALRQNGGQISPELQNTSDAWRVIPDLSR